MLKINDKIHIAVQTNFSEKIHFTQKHKFENLDEKNTEIVKLDKPSIYIYNLEE